MRRDTTTKSPNLNCFHVPRQLWRIIKRELPKPPKGPRRGRPRVHDRNVVTAFGRCCGRVINGKPCIAIGSSCPAVYCTSVFKPDNGKAIGNVSCAAWCVTMRAGAGQPGSGKALIAKACPPLWAAPAPEKTPRIGANEEAKSTFW